MCVCATYVFVWVLVNVFGYCVFVFVRVLCCYVHVLYVCTHVNLCTCLNVNVFFGYVRLFLVYVYY